MNYPRIFERVYCQPLCVTRQRFDAVHAFLLPRLTGNAALSEISAAIAPGSGGQPRPTTSPYSGKRAQKVGPKVDYMTGAIVDPRFYTVPAPGIACIPVFDALAKNLSSWEEACGGGTDIGPIGFAISQAAADPEIHTLLFDHDSPGGEVVGIPELAAQIAAVPTRTGKRTVSLIEGAGCSADYWLACSAQEVYCTRSAVVGSIGTYLALLDATVAMQMQGLKLELFAEGKHKGMGLPGRPLTDDDRAFLEARVAEVNGWFTSAVQVARPDVTEDTMQGQVFSGTAALSRGLVDGLVSGFEELVDLLAATD